VAECAHDDRALDGELDRLAVAARHPVDLHARHTYIGQQLGNPIYSLAIYGLL
jgi:hypothetical protein